MTDYTVGDTIYAMFTTRAFASGVPTVLAGTPVVAAYENDSAVQITAGITLGVSHDSVVGMNLLTIVATGGNGFESGKDYNLVITTGTVGGVSVVGEVVATFSIGRSAAAVDLANGTDGLGAIKTETAAILVDTGTTLQAELDAIQAAVITNAAGADIAADIIALKAETATIVADTNELQSDNVPGLIAALNDITAANVWAVDATGQQTQGTFGQALGDPGATAKSLWQATVSDAAGASVSADVIAVKAETAAILNDTDLIDDGTSGLAKIATDVAAILVDTGEIGSAGAGLTDLGGMSTGMKAEVNIEADGALDTAISELSQGIPTATPTVRTALMLMYMALRNKLDVATSATDTLEVHNDAGTRIAQKLLTDDGSDYSEAKMSSGA